MRGCARRVQELANLRRYDEVGVGFRWLVPLILCTSYLTGRVTNIDEVIQGGCFSLTWTRPVRH